MHPLSAWHLCPGYHTNDRVACNWLKSVNHKTYDLRVRVHSKKLFANSSSSSSLLPRNNSANSLTSSSYQPISRNSIRRDQIHTESSISRISRLTCRSGFQIPGYLELYEGTVSCSHLTTGANRSLTSRSSTPHWSAASRCSVSVATRPYQLRAYLLPLSCAVPVPIRHSKWGPFWSTCYEPQGGTALTLI